MPSQVGQTPHVPSGSLGITLDHTICAYADNVLQGSILGHQKQFESTLLDLWRKP